MRIGSTSYLGNDSLLDTIRRVGPVVEDVELVLYDVEGHGSNIPDAETAREMARLAEEFSLTYTVHLPMDLNPRDRSLPLAERVVAATLPLAPCAYVAHLDGRPLMQGGDVARWQAEGVALLNHLAAITGPEAICLENLEGWKADYLEDIIEGTGVWRCIDVGHLWLEGNDPLPFLARHLHRTRVIHLHGVAEVDHRSLEHTPRAQVRAVVEYLLERRYAGVVTLEMFAEDEFAASLEILREVGYDLEAPWGLAPIPVTEPNMLPS